MEVKVFILLIQIKIGGKDDINWNRSPGRIKEELKYGNYYPWRDEHIRINRFSGFGSNGQPKMFEELIIEGDQ